MTPLPFLPLFFSLETCSHSYSFAILILFSIIYKPNNLGFSNYTFYFKTDPNPLKGNAVLPRGKKPFDAHQDLLLYAIPTITLQFLQFSISWISAFFHFETDPNPLKLLSREMPGKSSMDQERIISCLLCTRMMIKKWSFGKLF